MQPLQNYFCFFASLFILVISMTGCDALYRFLQKEGAEEKALVGEMASLTANPQVREVQKLLKLYGYNPGTPDGKLGLKTRNALAKFQEDTGLKATRFIDKNTWQRLHVFDDSGLIKNGEVNVRELQTLLKAAGFNPGEVDGRMGPQTLKAIQDFQKSRGLKSDGRVGFKTLNELIIKENSS